jgi:hypothetical protein
MLLGHGVYTSAGKEDYVVLSQSSTSSHGPLSSAPAFAMIIAATAAGSATASPIVLSGLTSDYHITLPEGSGSISAQAGIGGPGRLGVFAEDRNPPVGRQFAERRAIFQFDLAPLAGAGNVVTAANFSVFLPLQNSGVNNRAAALYGSAPNRNATIEFSDAGSTNQFSDASYGLLQSAFLPSGITPPQYNNRFGSSDITSFLQSRLNDYIANPANRYVFFRVQVDTLTPFTNAFFEISSGDATDASERPQLSVTVVPTPGVGVGLLTLGVAMRRRR